MQKFRLWDLHCVRHDFGDGDDSESLKSFF